MAGVAGPATFTAVGSGVQLVSVSYVDAGGVVVGTDSGTVTVTAVQRDALAGVFFQGSQEQFLDRHSGGDLAQ
ncbi:hypothetical protein [Streptomyces sp. NPDC001843]|uniref:hypothetical protein n=1 Tax=Streptomyces sp. NPDC001843 TaxID=3364617 RepID=UPI0036ACDF42